jgi:hypothetical protein
MMWGDGEVSRVENYAAVSKHGGAWHVGQPYTKVTAPIMPQSPNMLPQHIKSSIFFLRSITCGDR